MLGKRASSLIEGQNQAQGSRSAHWRSATSYVTDRDHVKCLRLGDLSLSESRVIDDSQLIYQGATHLPAWRESGADYEKSTERAFETQASTSSSPCHRGNRTHGVMSFVGQAQNISAEGDRVDYHPMLSEEDVQVQKEEGEDQVQQARRGNAANSSSELNAAYFSGDSDLTAEAMAEESSHSSSQENGCTLKLEASATKLEHLSKSSKTVDQQQQIGDATILFTGRSSIEGQNSSWGVSKSADGRCMVPGTMAATEVCGFPRATQVMHVRGVKEVTSPIARREDAFRQEIVEREESWLDLRLGHTNSESYELQNDRNQQGNRSTSAEHTDPCQGTMVTLQLLPQKCDSATSPREWTENRSKTVQDMAIQFNPSARQGYTNDQLLATGWGSIGGQLQTFLPSGSAPFTSLMAKMDMNVQDQKRIYQADQYNSAWNRPNPSPEGFYIGRTNALWEDQVTEVTTYTRVPYIGYGDRESFRQPIIPTAVREMNEHPWLAAAARSTENIAWRPKTTVMDAFDQGIHHLRRDSGGHVVQQPHMRSFLLPNQLQQPSSRLLPPPSAAHQFPATSCKRLVNPPSSRGHPGVWFSLQAASSHDNEHDATPMQKTYMRIRDGQTPISVLKKYLVCKLGLSSETEVDISCRGNLLLSNCTLQHVRDKIWCTDEVEHGDTLGFRSTRSHPSHPKECIMALHYQRHSCGLTLNLLKG